MLDYLLTLVSRLGQWGYLIIFLGATLECAAFLGVLVPGEALVLFGGFLAANGSLEVGDLTFWVCVGAVLGDSLGYELGRHLGRPWLLRYGRWVGVREWHLARAEAFFQRHGGKTVLLGRFIGFLRALVPFVAGTSGMPYRRFFPYNAAGAVLWSVSFVLLGYVLGWSWQLVEQWLGAASAILGAVLVLVIGLIWLGRWLVRHEADVKHWWAGFLAHPRVVALRQRLAPQLAFVQARLAPGGYLGLHLTVGVLILVTAAWLFGAVVEDVLRADPLVMADQRVALWLHRHATPTLTAVMRGISTLASSLVISLLTVLSALALALRRRWYWLLDLLLVVPGGALLNALLKDIFDRARPSFESPFVHLTTYGFPSGHTVSATLFYGLLAVFALHHVPSWRWRVATVLATVLLIVLVGFSRLYLGAHYLSDVLAAIAEGVAWLALCHTAVETLRRGRERVAAG
jgi:membrane protein DedA with SNARE-associated domain/membrane-associated phospholipid phosphatase